MSQFVLDCSVSMAWCFPDESTAQSYEILERLREQTAIVPSLWHLETANILSMALRRKRIDDARLNEFLGLVGCLRIHVDQETVKRALSDILILTRRFELTAYDAAYLELAQRLNVPLATKDKQMIRAARQLKIAVIEG